MPDCLLKTEKDCGDLKSYPKSTMEEPLAFLPLCFHLLSCLVI